MAHKKAGGSSRNGRDSAGKRLGVKLFGGETLSSPATSSCASAARNGIPARMSAMGVDHTLFALIDGRVEYRSKSKNRTFVSVVPMTEAAAE